MDCIKVKATYIKAGISHNLPFLTAESISQLRTFFSAFISVDVHNNVRGALIRNTGNIHVMRNICRVVVGENTRGLTEA